MELTTVWFILIAVLWIGYFVLEGFDFGVGMLLPFVGKNEAERRAVVTTLGPVWDGNEVWVLVAGGATFAAFPEWYATLFSGFYLPLFLILVALIIRGVAFEYRSKRSDGSWRSRWDIVIFIGSALPALLWGVAFANIVRGVPLEEQANGNIEYMGGFWNLLNPFALLGGGTFVAIFLTHGAIFLSLKTTGAIRERAYAVGIRTGLVATVLAVAYLIWAQLAFSDKAWTWIPVLLAAVSWLAALAMHRARSEGKAFIFSAVTIGLAVIALFGMLFPNVMPNINEGASLTTENASSTEYTLTIMTWVAVVFTPIVLAYQAWSYWVFRKRVGPEHIAEPEIGSLDEVPA